MNKETVTAKQKVNIIGGGAAALFLACQLDPKNFSVTIYEKNNALARKFLVAGKGGFNLTHSESKEKFVEKYSPKDKVQEVFEQFDNVYFINWLNSIGIETIVGSSRRVFPKKDMKPIEVLHAIENVLKKNGVEVKYGVEWSFPSTYSGQANQEPHISDTERVEVPVSTDSMTTFPNDITIFALGGSSWKVTGSDGAWQNEFKKMGIETVPFQASNCAFKVEWSSEVKSKLEGKALKNSTFSCGTKKIMGEAVITQFGIEGSGVYPLSGEVRASLFRLRSTTAQSNNEGKATIFVDLKPEISEEKIRTLLQNKKDLSVKEVLMMQVKLSDTAFQLIKLSTTKEEYSSSETLTNCIKNFPIKVLGLAPIDDAISTVGGVSWNELTKNFELKKIPNTYCIGEMLDWDAPTGGYLLQMCFSMGFGLGDYLNRKK